MVSLGPHRQATVGAADNPIKQILSRWLERVLAILELRDETERVKKARTALGKSTKYGFNTKH
jgi:hypothetical protein